MAGFSFLLHCHRIEQSSSIPTSFYEFPNGYNINLTIEKFRLCEGLFNAANLSGISGGDLLSIPNVVLNSAAMCDIEIRPVSVRERVGVSEVNLLSVLKSLYSSLVVVGGNSLLPGFTDRLTKELSHKTPPVRCSSFQSYLPPSHQFTPPLTTSHIM